MDLPKYATEHSAGLDLCAALDNKIVLESGQRALIPTGFSVEIPTGYEGQVRGRSGLALKHGIGLPNSPGTIDSDYRGELCVILINWSNTAFIINRGDRIAQLIIAPVEKCAAIEVFELSETGAPRWIDDMCRLAAEAWRLPPWRRRQCRSA